MALQDIERYEEAISEVARVLKNSGRFIFSIPHPCFEHIVKDEENIISWRYREGTENIADKRPLHLEIKKYFGIGKYEIRWNSKRITKPFRTSAFHRTLTEYFQALYANRLLVSRLFEPRPTLKAVSVNAAFYVGVLALSILGAYSLGKKIGKQEALSGTI